MKYKVFFSTALSGVLFFPLASQSKSQPNILLIMADDMAYSDIGCFGGEIETPNLDRMANNGIRFSQFYNGARSCPTRASLLTGLYPHQAGMGWMTVANLGTPQYQGELNQESLTIAEVLRTSGYKTYMSGKWHLTRNYDEGPNADKHNWPLQRGFDRFFGTIHGGSSYFTPHGLTSGNTQFKPQQPFYYTDAISDTAVSFIQKHPKNKPFFMYVAYTAPHWPLHALEKDIEKYKGKYNRGWDFLRKQRYERMLEMGVIPKNTQYPERHEDASAWYAIPKRLQSELAHRMEVYAAQVDNMDQGIGRILAELEKNNQLENTLIIFLSDNGGCAEMISNDNREGEIGTDNSFESYGLGWANAGNSPFKMFKHWTHEGGIATPMIVHWGKEIKEEHKGKFWDKPAHIVDIAATFYEVGKVNYPALIKKNKKIQPLEGQSFYSVLNWIDNQRKPIFWEHEANIAMRDGKWKLVAKADEGSAEIGKLELYNIEEDRSETNDLSEKHPELTKKMFAEWLVWANRIKVFPLDSREYGVRQRESRKKEQEIWEKRRKSSNPK